MVGLAVPDHNQISLQRLFCGPTSVLNVQLVISLLEPSGQVRALEFQQKIQIKKKKGGDRDEIVKRTCTNDFPVFFSSVCLKKHIIGIFEKHFKRRSNSFFGSIPGSQQS